MEDLEIRPPRVLVADDDETVREVTKEMLRGLGMVADSARTRGEMVDRYRRAMLAGRRYDLVILGVYRPFELDGGAATTMLLEIDPDARVIISTAMLWAAFFPPQVSRGIVRYLDRPYRMQDLAKAVRDALPPLG